MERRIYLDYLPLSEILKKFDAALDEQGFSAPVSTETISVADAYNRVAAEAVFAPRSSPAFHASAVDGIAVKAEDTYGALETSPKRLIEKEQAEVIDTGDPVPENFNAVIMIEDVFEPDPGVYEILKPVFPWENVRPFGEDMVKTELVATYGRTIRPEDIGAMLAAGLTEIKVRRKPKVGIVPTGTELAETPQELQPGQVIESNSWVLKAMVESWGAEPKRWPLLVDDYEMIKQAVVEAVDECDAVVINAGTSAGREDFSASIIEELGTLVSHGASLRPGRTAIIGVIKGKPVMGFAGFPVANYIHAETFLRPLVYRLLGTYVPEGTIVKAKIAKKMVSPLGVREIIQVKVAELHGSYVAAPLPRGSGVTMSLVRSNGELVIPAESEGIHRGDEVEIRLKSDVSVINNNILAVGSHDLVLDILGDSLKIVHPELSLASTNVGSYGGLMAIKDNITHIAGTHLLDKDTGKYNIDFIERILGDMKVRLVTLAYRMQGLIVAKGNPKDIKSISDLTREDVRFINRQNDAGTRVLLDYFLGRLSIDTKIIYGYTREVFTHTAVAAAISSGSADAGLGVWAAAEALGMDFIPIEEERYDLLMTDEFFISDHGQKLIETIGSEKFKERLGTFKGYSARETGNIII